MPQPSRPSDDLAAIGRAIVDGNEYLTLATADAAGVPWASPVWFAHDGYARFTWVSRPGARHSRNLAERPEVGIVIFDSTVAIGTGQGVYLEAVARVAGDAERDALLAVFSDRAEASGGRRWGPADVTGDAPFRLYVADALVQYVLDDHDQRVAVTLG